MDFQVKDNSRSGWQAVWKNLRDKISTNSKGVFTFSVELNTENDVTSLRYFLPLRSFLRRKGIVAQLNLLGHEEMLQRAKQFLGALIHYDSLHVYFGHAANNQRGSICKNYIELDNALTDEEKSLVSCILSGMSMKKDAPNQYTYSFYYPEGRTKRADGNYLINYSLLRSSIYAIHRTAPSRNNTIIFRTHSSYFSSPSDLLPLIAIGQSLSSRGSDVKELINLYRGYSNERFSEKGFEPPKVDIPSFENNPLAELIFYFLLRNLHDSGRIICSVGGKSEFDITLLKRTALDAKSYAEGLWQIIENAQQHSYGKTAYFGMRIYKADAGASMAELTKEATTRSILWRNYWLTSTATLNKGSAINSTDSNNIFNLTAPGGNKVYTDFIEFYVLDDAIGDDGIPQGILEKIRSDQETLDKSRKLSSISEIFNLEEADYSNKSINFYIKHYGMRWLNMHADRLNAIVQIYSPHLVDSFSYQDQDYVKADSLGGFCFSNVFPDGYLLSAGHKLSVGAVVHERKGDVIGKILNANNETFIIEAEGSPDKKSFPAENLELLLPYPPCYSTEYSILVPLAYSPVLQRLDAGKVKPMSFDTGKGFYRDVQVEKRKLDFKDIEEKLKTLGKKVDDLEEKNIAIDELKNTLYTTVFPNQHDNFHNAEQPCLGHISLDNHTPQYIELLAKAFFSLIHDTTKADFASHRRPLLFAIDFGSEKDLISEFVRIFSIFYTKQGKSAYMSGVQIALCSDVYTGGKKEVNFILAGQTLRSAYNTAINFVYHNADSSLEYVPLLEYLTPPDTEKAADAVPLCPFDLLLTNENGQCWFLDLMKEKLETDQRTNRYGCKLSNIHVRLGSKIHINNFYEAELLFHNLGNINRFAYLIARHIDRYLPEKAQHVFLVGYENYSSVLLQEIVRLLGERHSTVKIQWVIDTHSAGKFPSISFDNFTEAECKSWANGQILCYTVIPIGSTMSTVHKLQDSFTRGITAAVNNCNLGTQNDLDIVTQGNYVIVAVGNCFTCPSNFNIEQNPVEHYYLKTIGDRQDYGWLNCTLQPHLDGKNGLQVYYCLAVDSQWHLANSLELSTISGVTGDRCYLSSPLIQVDKTSTLLNAIFQTPLPSDVLRYYVRTHEKDSRSRNKYLDLLRPDGQKNFIQYGHIVQGDNHYQFYFDFKSMVNSPKIYEKLTKWARNISVDEDAYNIVVSPLQITNAVFLKTIVDCVFGSNLHLLHIDINGTAKETVRTKFEYISEELKRISSAYSAIHFYYVDDSICTDATIQRAYKFLLMLCKQAGIELSNLQMGRETFRFKKVFLFVNRSSYETAQTWVQSPVDDWLGFINICIPSYNTHANTCPSCRVQNRFMLLSKRSATNQLMEYFSGGAFKHKARTPAEYDRYLADEILDNPAYLNWLRTYVAYHDKIPATVMEKDQYKDIRGVLLDCTRSDAKTLRQLQSMEYLPFEIIIRYVVAQEHFCRLNTMNHAYRTLIYGQKLQKTYRQCTEGKEINSKNLNFETYRIELMKTLLSLLVGALSNGKNIYDQIMAFSSYIKVTSRDYISRNYFIREAIYTVLHSILLILIAPLAKDTRKYDFKMYFKSHSVYDQIEQKFCTVISDEKYASAFYTIWEKIGTPASGQKTNIDLFYRVLKITIHRLALLHSRFIISEDIIRRVLERYIDLLDDNKEDQWRLPSVDELLKTYLVSIKTATMSEDDDSMCHDLLKLGRDLNGE